MYSVYTSTDVHSTQYELPWPLPPSMHHGTSRGQVIYVGPSWFSFAEKSEKAKGKANRGSWVLSETSELCVSCRV